MNRIKAAREKRFRQVRERAMKRRANLQTWRAWSRKRSLHQKRTRKLHKDRPAVIRNDRECEETMKSIATICQRAYLPRCAMYLLACVTYLQQRHFVDEPVTQNAKAGAVDKPESVGAQKDF
jgi:hypothetical protein